MATQGHEIPPEAQLPTKPLHPNPSTEPEDKTPHPAPSGAPHCPSHTGTPKHLSIFSSGLQVKEGWGHTESQKNPPSFTPLPSSLQDPAYPTAHPGWGPQASQLRGSFSSLGVSRWALPLVSDAHTDGRENLKTAPTPKTDSKPKGAAHPASTRRAPKAWGWSWRRGGGESGRRETEAERKPWVESSVPSERSPNRLQRKEDEEGEGACLSPSPFPLKAATQTSEMPLSVTD